MNKKIKKGKKVSIKKIFNKRDVFQYLELSGDSNPIHQDKEYAQKTPFKFCIVPGLLVASLFGGLLGSQLPGHGTIHLGQTLNFKNPVYINEEITAIIEVIKTRDDKPVITFKTVCFKNNGEIAVEGEAVVKYNN